MKTMNNMFTAKMAYDLTQEATSKKIQKLLREYFIVEVLREIRYQASLGKLDTTISVSRENRDDVLFVIDNMGYHYGIKSAEEIVVSWDISS